MVVAVFTLLRELATEVDKVAALQSNFRTCLHRAASLGKAGVPAAGKLRLHSRVCCSSMHIYMGNACAGPISLGVKEPCLGPLLECVAARLVAANRHHKGLLAFHQWQPELRYSPFIRYLPFINKRHMEVYRDQYISAPTPVPWPQS